ncbi:hypothetical protein GCM10007967_28250 [Xylanimonas ulmi]
MAGIIAHRGGSAGVADPDAVEPRRGGSAAGLRRALAGSKVPTEVTGSSPTIGPTPAMQDTGWVALTPSPKEGAAAPAGVT